jgi:dihydrofolate synthase/folylpolyglutamate synthase
VNETRYRCTSCGNLTRFDVTVLRRTRGFHHYSLAGDLEIEDPEVLSEVALAEPLVGEPLSWFELVTAAALTWFATTAVDVAVVEVGMLGRWDATNVVDASVAVITNIGRDHTDGVGDWRATVAQEKAGIIRGEGVAVLGERDQRLHGAFAAEGPRELWVVDNDFAAEAVRPAVGGVPQNGFVPSCPRPFLPDGGDV